MILCDTTTPPLCGTGAGKYRGGGRATAAGGGGDRRGDRGAGRAGGAEERMRASMGTVMRYALSSTRPPSELGLRLGAGGAVQAD